MALQSDIPFHNEIVYSLSIITKSFPLHGDARVKVIPDRHTFCPNIFRKGEMVTDNHSQIFKPENVHYWQITSESSPIKYNAYKQIITSRPKEITFIAHRFVSSSISLVILFTLSFVTLFV